MITLLLLVRARYIWVLCTLSETSLEAIFKSRGRPAWNFSLQKGQYFCKEKSLQTKSLFSHFGVWPLLGIFEKKTLKRTWFYAGISPVW